MTNTFILYVFNLTKKENVFGFLAIDMKLTNFWLTYSVRFAGGSVASEVQLMDNFSPT